jgi:hypothetical protein
MMRVLIVAAVISLAIGIAFDPGEGWLEGAAILVAVCIVVIVGATNDFLK